MTLDEAQRKKVAEWIGQGLKLSEIQNRLGTELGLNLTYMDVRLLVDDLKLTPKDVERSKAGASGLQASPATTARSAPSGSGSGATGIKPGAVSVSVDQIARPGAVVSGKVTFSDGNKAAWYLDQIGQFGLVPEQAGYRPAPADLQQFETILQNEMRKLGF